MQKKKFELIFTHKLKQSIVELGIGQYFIGTEDNCIFHLEGDGPSRKALIQVTKDYLLIKVIDPALSFENSDNPKVLKIDECGFDNLGGLDIIISSISETGEKTMPQGIEVPSLPHDALGHVAPADKYIPEFVKPGKDKPSLVEAPYRPDSSLTEKAFAIAAPVDATAKVSAVSPGDMSTGVLVDGEVCDIVFDTSHYAHSYSHPVEVTSLDYTNYIDPFDAYYEEGTRSTDSIDTPVEGDCVSIVHQDNGVVLTQEYFPFSANHIYISESLGNKRTLKVHDCGRKKAEIVFIKDGIVQVEKVDGYQFHRVNQNGTLEELDGTHVILRKNERIVLSRGTGQIIIKLDQSPPKLIGTEFFRIEEQLLKLLVATWTAVLLPLIGILLFVTVPKKEDKKKIVIIYKKKPHKKIMKQKKKPLEPKQAEKKKMASNQPKQKKKLLKEINKKPNPAKVSKTPKKLVQKKPQPVAKKHVKKTPTQAKSKSVAKKVSKANTARESKVKSYSFNTSSKMAVMVGSAAANAATVKGTKAFVSNTAGGTSMARSTNYGNVGKVNTSVGKFASSEVAGLDNTYGTRGLAEKGGADTAYVETSTRVLGAIDPNLIRKIMREYIPQFRHCYQKELIRNTSVQGVFDLEFKINSVGNARDVRVSNNGMNFSKKGVNCIKRVFSLIKFPRPKGGGLVDVKQPLNFYSNKR